MRYKADKQTSLLRSILAGRALVPLAAACLAPAFAVQIKCYDVWWHLATGRWIVANGRLPTVDPFTYTMAGKPWRLVNGIADVALYGMHCLGGVAGVVLVNVICAWATLTLLGLSLQVLRVGRVVLLTTLALGALLLQARYSLARPLIMGAVLIAGASLAALRWHRAMHEHPAAAPPIRYAAFFALALPLWPQVHGTALVGLAQLGALLCACWLSGTRRRQRRWVELTLLAALVLSALLPWWQELYEVALDLRPDATAMQLTDEWSSASEAAGEHVGRWLAIAGGIAGGAIRLRQSRRAGSAEPLPLLLALLGAALATRYGRNAFEGVLLALPGLAAGLQLLAAAVDARGRRRLGRALILGCGLAVGLIQLGTAPRRTLNAPWGFSVVRGRFPYDTLVTLRQLPPGRLIHGFPLGGFLIWHSGWWGVYSDGRTVALYREADVQELFMPLLESAERLTAAADRWQAPYGLTQHLSHPNQWMMVSPEWVPLHLGLGTSLFVRRHHLAALPPTVKPLHLLRYTAVEAWTRGWYRGIVADPQLRSQLEDELGHAAALSPYCPILDRIVAVVFELDPPLGRRLAVSAQRARDAAASEQRSGYVQP